MAESRVCLGVMVGAHGVRGLVKVKPFTEVPEDVAAYGPVSDKTGRRTWRLEIVGKGPGKSGGVVLVRVEGVTDRDAAQALHGTELYVAREALPALEEEETFYHADLIGLRVEDEDGRVLGRVTAVENFGGGDFLEVEEAGGAKGATVRHLPFTRQVVPLVDLSGGRLVVARPEELEVPPQPAGSGAPDAED